MIKDTILIKLVNEQSDLFNDPNSTSEQRESKLKEIKKRQKELVGKEND
jgi:hypothetical protein